jgi:hypothetical protein
VVFVVGDLTRAITAALAEPVEIPAKELVRLNGGRKPRVEELDRLTAKAKGHVRNRRVAGLRAAAVLRAAEAVQEGAGRVPAALPSGEVRYFESVTLERGWVGGTAVRVRPLGAPTTGEADVVIVNPPCLVPYPGGEVDVDGIPHKEDPLAALALAVESVTAPGSEDVPWPSL